MPKVRDGQSDFTGGLRTNGSIFDGQDNEVSELINWRVDPSGSLVVRLGTQQITPALSDFAQEVYHWKRTSGTSMLLASTFDRHVHYSDDPEHNNYPLSFVDAGAVSTNGASFFVGFRDSLNEVAYFRGGAGFGLLKFNGLTFTAVGGTPGNLGQLVVYNRRLFSFNGSTLYWSDLDNGDSLGVAAAGGGQAVIRTFGGGGIVGLHVLGTTLFIFHRTSVSAFRGWTQDDIDIESGTSVVSHPVGLVSTTAATAFNGYLYFVGHDEQVYRMSENGIVEPISNQVRDAIASDINGITYVIANSADREIWVTPQASQTTWVYNVDRNVWYKFVLGGASWAWFAELSSRNSDTQPTILGVSSNNGLIYDLKYPGSSKDQVSTTGTGGNSITATVDTKHLTFGDPALVKALRFLYVAVGGDASHVVSPFLIDEHGASTALTPFAPTGEVDRVQAWGRYKAPRVRLTYNGGGFAKLSDIYLDAFVYNRPT